MVDIYLQARMSSKRLPNKTLTQIINSKSMLSLCIERLKKIQRFRKIILIITQEPDDDILESYAKDTKLDFWRGDSNYVLSSFRNALRKFKSRNVLRATADNPLVDPQEASRLILSHIKTNADYSTNRSEQRSGLAVGLPIGVGVEIFSARAIEFISKKARKSNYKEHINDFIFENKDMFRINVLSPPKSKYAPNLSLTVDTKKDLRKMRSIYKKLYKKNTPIKVSEVIKLLSA